MTHKLRVDFTFVKCLGEKIKTDTCKSYKLPMSVPVVLLAHGYSCSFTFCPWLLSLQRRVVPRDRTIDHLTLYRKSMLKPPLKGHKSALYSFWQTQCYYGSKSKNVKKNDSCTAKSSSKWFLFLKRSAIKFVFFWGGLVIDHLRCCCVLFKVSPFFQESMYFKNESAFWILYSNPAYCFLAPHSTTLGWKCQNLSDTEILAPLLSLG